MVLSPYFCLLTSREDANVGKALLKVSLQMRILLPQEVSLGVIYSGMDICKPMKKKKWLLNLVTFCSS